MAYTEEQINKAYNEICQVSLSLGITEDEMKKYLRDVKGKTANQIGSDLERIIVKLQSNN